MSNKTKAEKYPIRITLPISVEMHKALSNLERDIALCGGQGQERVTANSFLRCYIEIGLQLKFDRYRISSEAELLSRLRNAMEVK